MPFSQYIMSIKKKKNLQDLKECEEQFEETELASEVDSAKEVVLNFQTGNLKNYD